MKAQINTSAEKNSTLMKYANVLTSASIVTIGLCVKNAEKTVEEAVNSILSQDYPRENLELIIVDGYSNDNTLRIIQTALDNKKMRYSVSKEKEGLGFARELVVRKAHGKYIIYVDGDMVMVPNFIRTQVDFMEQNPKVGVAIGKFSVYLKGNWLSTLQCLLWMTEDKISQNTIFSKPVRSTCCGAIFRTRVLKHVGGFDQQIRGACEDVDVFCKISRAGWLVYSTTNTLFCDRPKETFKALWKEHFWYGYGGHYVYHKHRNDIVPRPLRIFDFIEAYKMSRRKIVFLAPFLYFFEKIAYILGFSQAHLEGYGH
jgi:glycosyltransferase involved in cell wall biosynthesis